MDAANGCDNGSAYCMRSGNAGVANSTSTIEITHIYSASGSISFNAKCMGEGTSTLWDHCDFFIDGVQQFSHGADVSGWNNYLFTVTAGAHTFTWSYSKDSSVDNPGDGFFVDNIIFHLGDPCISPSAITVSTTLDGDANFSWNGISSSYALRYRPEGSGAWTTVTGITDQNYTISGLTPGLYNVQVAAECDPENWVSGSFTIMEILSTANWYGYADYTFDGEDWEGKFISFTMQDPSTVTAATSSTVTETFAAAYANGYVWAITTSGDLLRATLNNSNKTISDFETVVSGFESGTAIDMSYNPVDGKMYYLTGTSLKSFHPNLPETITEIGTLDNTLMTLAINSSGVAYGVEYSTGNLYQVNLTNATPTLVNNTGQNCSFVQSMAFDLTTGELFWAQIHSSSDVGLYKVDPATAETVFMGQIGGGSGIELTGLFMGDDNQMACLAPTGLTVSDPGAFRSGR